MFITAVFIKLVKSRILLLALCDFLTVVLDDAFKVIRHQVPQGTFVRQAETVREHNGRVHDCTVDELEATEKKRTLHQGVFFYFSPTI